MKPLELEEDDERYFLELNEEQEAHKAAFELAMDHYMVKRKAIGKARKDNWDRILTKYSLDRRKRYVAEFNNVTRRVEVTVAEEEK